MRKIKVFNKQVGYCQGVGDVTSGQATSATTGDPNNIVPSPTELESEDLDIDAFQETDFTEEERKAFMTPSLLKMMLKEMRRPVNIRFLKLIRSTKQIARQLRNNDDIELLKKFMAQQLTLMLSDYADVLGSNNSLQLSVYLKVNSVVPTAAAESRNLSRIMIRANKVKASQGFLPQKNQRDLNKGINSFINAVIEGVFSTLHQGVEIDGIGDGGR